MNPLGLDQLTMVGVSPPEFIRTAAAAGVRHVALWPRQGAHNPHGCPDYSLIDDAALRRETARGLEEHGVSIAMIEPLEVSAGLSVERHRSLLDIFAELGVKRANTVSFDEWDRTVDETSRLAEIAREYGVDLTHEMNPFRLGGTLEQAVELVRAVNSPNFSLLIDTMHVARSGGAATLAKIDPKMIGYVQISDAPLYLPDADEYKRQALDERLIPGEGELPLVEMLRCVPDHVVVSGEVPMRSAREAGVDILTLSRRVVYGMKRVLEAARSPSAIG